MKGTTEEGIGKAAVHVFELARQWRKAQRKWEAKPERPDRVRRLAEAAGKLALAIDEYEAL